MGERIDFATKVRLTRVLLNTRQWAIAETMGVAPITMSRWETGAQVPHRTMQRMFVIFAERSGIVFDLLGYPSLGGSRSMLPADLPHLSGVSPSEPKRSSTAHFKSLSESPRG
jgi:DNA-binding XRE family transcriptional regulator